MGNSASKNSGRTLSEYLEYLYKENVCFKHGTKEVDDITDSVKELVCRIIQAVGEKEERFTCSNIHFVGSMAEGTRIFAPNEFDFLVVVDSLSAGAGLKLTRQCHANYGSVHIAIDSTNEDVVKNWKDILVMGELKSTNLNLYKEGFKQKFLKVLQKVVIELMTKNCEISKDAGILKIADASVIQHGPACLCTFLWTSVEQTTGCKNKLPISVDITPAIRFTDVERVISPREIDSDELYTLLKEANEFLVISCDRSTCYAGTCFKITFTLIELELMKGLSEQHIKCYKLLKYLFKCPDSEKGLCVEVFHSYALKTFLLKHAIKGQCSEKELSLCVLKMIADIEESLRTRMSLFCQGSYKITVRYTLFPLSNIFYHKPVSYDKYKKCKIAIQGMKYILNKIAAAHVPESNEKKIKKFRNQPVPNYFSCVETVPISVFCKNQKGTLLKLCIWLVIILISVSLVITEIRPWE